MAARVDGRAAMPAAGRDAQGAASPAAALPSVAPGSPDEPDPRIVSVLARHASVSRLRGPRHGRPRAQGWRAMRR